MARIEPTLAAAKALADRNAGLDWRKALAVYLRLLAIGHLAWALWQWAALVGVVPPLDGEMTRAQLPRMGASWFFACLDPVAAVGLWLGATWGTATWLVVTFARVVIHTGYAGIFGWDVPMTVFQVTTILIYLALFLFAERAEREARKRSRRAV